MTFEEHLKEMMKDPEFVKAYNEPDPEFDLGIQIYRARVNKGLSQKQVSEMTGIDQGNLSKIETGERVANIKTIQRIASCLGMTIALIPLGK